MERFKKPKGWFSRVIVKSWKFEIKVIELILAIISMVFLYESLPESNLTQQRPNYAKILYAVYIGSMVVIIIFIGKWALKRPFGYVISGALSMINCVMYLIVGLLLYKDYGTLTMMMISITTTFINMAVFAIDAFLTFRSKLEDTLEISKKTSDNNSGSNPI